MSGAEEDNSAGQDALRERKEALEKELAVTTAVLAERGVKLSEIDEELHRIKYEMERLGGTDAILRGDAAMVVNREAFRQMLKRKAQALERKRGEAFQDVERARDRMVMIEQELALLG